METPRTDEHLRLKEENGHLVVVGADFARRLEQENRDLLRVLYEAGQALACFAGLRGMSAAELKSAHNGICILLEKTKILNKIKAGLENVE